MKVKLLKKLRKKAKEFYYIGFCKGRINLYAKNSLTPLSSYLPIFHYETTLVELFEKLKKCRRQYIIAEVKNLRQH